MPRVDLTEPYAIRNARKQIRESLQAHGEEVIALRMFHAHPDAGTQPRCPVCFDDIYQQGERSDCSACYGTTFEGGIKEWGRAWALFTNAANSEARKRRGQYQTTDRQMQMEAFPIMWENDYVFRVAQWSQDHRPVTLGGAYILDTVTEETLRTGNQYAQDGNDRVGQRAPVHELPPEHVIYRAWRRVFSPDFPVPRLDGLPR